MKTTPKFKKRDGWIRWEGHLAHTDYVSEDNKFFITKTIGSKPSWMVGYVENSGKPTKLLYDFNTLDSAKSFIIDFYYLKKTPFPNI